MRGQACDLTSSCESPAPAAHSSSKTPCAASPLYPGDLWLPSAMGTHAPGLVHSTSRMAIQRAAPSPRQPHQAHTCSGPSVLRLPRLPFSERGPLPPSHLGRLPAPSPRWWPRTRPTHTLGLARSICCSDHLGSEVSYLLLYPSRRAGSNHRCPRVTSCQLLHPPNVFCWVSGPWDSRIMQESVFRAGSTNSVLLVGHLVGHAPNQKILGE
ncbi:hypothetical protein NDU88_009536 [Pleurodeles waltl]|uniref:Uncharacterized protein n=1 Tax=Pleurodeles waltl TaxID=8319 RepID=A0AAV7QXU2_PLEWA|nr:hypothetical protein NDU88_009536 [Pleurodeles waltl]